MESSASSSQDRQGAFVSLSNEPSMEAEGVRFDFTCGLRMQLPDDGRTHRVLVTEQRTNALLLSVEAKPGEMLVCPKKYFIRYSIKVDGKPVHDFYAADRDVLVQIPPRGALGDSIAWFAPLRRFQTTTKCRLHVLMPPHVADLFRNQYKDFIFETEESVKDQVFYAAYCLGLFPDDDQMWQPHDYRLMGLSEAAASILGLEDIIPLPPCVDLSHPSPIQEPYVCIATQASAHAKSWNNPSGWRLVIKWLREQGLRVLCVDGMPEWGSGDVWHHIPNGCEDFTGMRPLQERIDLIHGAKAFIGLSSGLSWVAWCCKVPVVLISGICMPFGEFRTMYRVQARHVCHGCWNDPRNKFDHSDYMWCPRHKGTPRAYECTRCITADMVIDRLKEILDVD